MAQELRVKIVGDTRGYQSALSKASGASGRFGAAAKRAGKMAAIGLGIGLGVAIVGLKKSFDAAQDAQVSQKKLQAQMRASGLSYRKFGDHIDKVITKQSRLAAVDDEDLQDSLTNILRIVPNVNRALELNALAADIAAARGMDLSKAGELVGKVAGGNLGILSRYGIVLEDGATKQEALAKLQQKFGGQAEAYGSSVAGAGDRVRVALENVAETIGEMVFPLAGKVLSAFSDALTGVQKFVDKIGRAKGFKAKFNVVWTGVTESVNNLIDMIRDALLGSVTRTPLKLKSGKIIDWQVDRQQGLVKSIGDGLRSADWTEIGKRVGEGISKRVRITADFLGNLLTTMNQFIDSHLDEFADTGAKMALAIINKLLDPTFWAENWKLVAGIAIAVFPVTRFLTLGGKIAGAVLRLVFKLLPPGFRNIGARAVDAILSVLGRLPGRVQRIIVSVVSAAIRALQDLLSWLRDKFKAALDKIPGWVRSAFRLGAILAMINAIKDLIGWIRAIPDIGTSVPGGRRPVGPGSRPGRSNPNRNTNALVPSGLQRGTVTSSGVPGGLVMVLTTREIANFLQGAQRDYGRANGGRSIL